jgi:ATP-dependent DNA ligase
MNPRREGRELSASYGANDQASLSHRTPRPVRCVLFDLLYHTGHCLVQEPLARCREVLAVLCQWLEAADVWFS